MKPTVEMVTFGAEAMELTMDLEGWDNEPCLVAYYARSDASTSAVVGAEFPGFNSAIEDNPLQSVLKALARIFADPGNTERMRKVVGAVEGYELCAIALGVETVVANALGKDTSEAPAIGVEVRNVVVVDTAGRVTVVTRCKGEEPQTLVSEPGGAVKAGGYAVAALRDVMLHLCTVLPDEGSDIVAVSQVVRVDLPNRIVVLAGSSMA